MSRNINSAKLTKQYILNKVSQITIFSTYLNLSDTIIKDCIDNGTLIKSPIREDNNPTCGFKYDNRNKLKFKDFNGFFWGDCFDIVAFIMTEMYNRSYNVSNKQDFIKILHHITLTFKDIFYGQERDINMLNTINDNIEKIKNKKQIIEIVVRQWNQNDVDYWNKFNVNINHLNINFVYPIDQYYINRDINPQPKYYYTEDDPCYAYKLGEDRNGNTNIKLYFPKRKKGNTRFISNCNHLEGIYNLDGYDYDIIVITKSTKDRVCMYANLGYITSLYGEFGTVKIGLINIPHETYKLRQNEYDWLYSKLATNGNILSLMDNDITGVKEAIWLRNNYGIIPIIFPRKFGVKDFSEFIEKFDNKTIYNVITRTIKQYCKREE